MAELVVARITLKLAWRLFAPEAASKLEDGDIAEERLRQLLLSEFNKINEHLNALRRKELVAAISFLETGFEVLPKDENTAKDEFKKSRDAAQMAFGVVPDVQDKILATKILVTSTFNEFNDNIETSKSLCSKYLDRMNTLPEVVKACEIVFSPLKGLANKFLSKTGKAKRDDVLQGVAEINKSVWDYFTKQLQTELSPAPVVRFNAYHINPVTDMVLHRRPALLLQLDTTLANFISVTMTKNVIFAAIGQITGGEVKNDIIAISLYNKRVTHLFGHENIVLSVCSNEHNLFSSSYDKTVIVWNLDTFQPLKTLTGHEGSVSSICVANDFLFSGSTDATVRVWDLQNDFECLEVLQASTALVKITCSRRKFLFCLDVTGRIQIWNTGREFKLLQVIETNEKCLNMIANDNHLIVPITSKTGESMQCWNLGSLTHTATIKESGTNIAKYYNSPYLVCGNEKVKMINTKSQNLITEDILSVTSGRFTAARIKYLWFNDCDLYVLSETNTGTNFIAKY